MSSKISHRRPLRSDQLKKKGSTHGISNSGWVLSNNIHTNNLEDLLISSFIIQKAKSSELKVK